MCIIEHSRNKNKGFGMKYEDIINYKTPSWDTMPDIGLYMDQVLMLLNKYIGVFFTSDEDGECGVTASMLNNYVKQKLVPSPEKKKYDRNRLSLFFMICILKRVLSITQIKELLNGLLCDKSVEEVYTVFGSLLDLCLRSEQLPDSEGFTLALTYAVRSFASVVWAEIYMESTVKSASCEQ